MLDDKKRVRIKCILIILACICVLWLVLALVNSYFVSMDKRPILCFNYQKNIENDDEYSLTCYGILYKYKEYYYIKSEAMSAREYTLFFKEFVREVK